MSEFRSQVRRALIWRSGMQIAAQAIQWVLTLVVIRLLVPRDYGLVAMTEVVTSFLVILAGYSFTSAIVQAPEVEERRIRQFFGLLIVINAGLAVLQFIGAPLAAAYYREPIITDMLRVQAINYLMIPFITMPLALASRNMEFRSPALVQFVAMISSGIAVVTLAWLGAGVWALVIGTVILHVTRAAGMTITMRWLVWPIFRFDGLGHLLSYGGAVLGNSILWFFYSQADIFIAGRHLAASEVGIYATGLFLASLPVTKVLPALNEVGFTAYARIQNDMDMVHSSFLRSTRMVTLLLFPMFAGLALVAPDFVPVVLGPQWLPAIPVIQTLAMAMPLYAIYVLQAPVTNAIGHPRVGLVNSLVGLAIMPAAFLVGVSWGARGLALAWLSAFPLLFVISTWNTLRSLGLPAARLGGAALPAVVSSLVMAAVLLGLRETVVLSPLPNLLVGVALGGGVYIAAVALIFPAAFRDVLGFAGIRLGGRA